MWGLSVTLINQANTDNREVKKVREIEQKYGIHPVTFQNIDYALFLKLQIRSKELFVKDASKALERLLTYPNNEIIADCMKDILYQMEDSAISITQNNNLLGILELYGMGNISQHATPEYQTEMLMEDNNPKIDFLARAKERLGLK